ncbi:MAG TPA: 2-dehydro-3-deoxygalactonokinase [Caulobacteraceae bacterium]|jgi:2-dehydro-3-deoxygalactonokinase
MAAALIVCDWGSTNLRAWTLDAGGDVVGHWAAPWGVNGLAPGEAPRRFDEVRANLGGRDLPALLCGAIGSNIGWRAIPYVDCPAGLSEVASGVAEVALGVFIAPGLRCGGLGGAGDVLRGEETKALGWLQLTPTSRRGRRLVCQPGTHPKWMLIEDGHIVRFQSAFTGELFAVLSAHSILRNDGAGADTVSFDEGLAAAGEGDALLNRLYGARSRVAGMGASPATTGAYLSGLLIGAEVAATPGLLGLEGEPVTVLAEEPLRGWYVRALTRRGAAVEVADGEPAARAGLVAIARERGLL